MDSNSSLSQPVVLLSSRLGLERGESELCSYHKTLLEINSACHTNLSYQIVLRHQKLQYLKWDLLQSKHFHIGIPNMPIFRSSCGFSHGTIYNQNPTTVQPISIVVKKSPVNLL